MDLFRTYNDLSSYIKPNKVLVIFGPRQVGKTTLLKTFLDSLDYKYKLDSGDNILIREILSSENFETILSYAQGYELIAIDEAQKIKNIGTGLKILVDQIPGIKVIATGSSSFELAGQIGEPLTGRKKSLTLFPIAQLELKQHFNEFELRQKIHEFLIFGSYPEVLTANSIDEKISVLNEITNSNLLKDILDLERIKSSKTLLNLLRLIAFQVGSEVSINELAQQLGIDFKTVYRYIDLLEKSFILYSVGGYSTNLRKEISKKNKYYFYDNGIRNSLIANFNQLELRNDTGNLWENFLFIERLKKKVYQNIPANNFFWRTYNQKEVDLVEERDGKLFGFEFKWGTKLPKVPTDWTNHYPDASYTVINQSNYLEFIT
jgi:uncharacterized protein